MSRRGTAGTAGPAEAPPPLQACAPTSAAAGPAVRQAGQRRTTTVSLKTMARERRQQGGLGHGICPVCRETPLRADNTTGICGYCQRIGARDLPRHPRTRAECDQVERPCPFLSCRHHLYLDVNPQTGSIKFNFPDVEPWELTETCALDVADRGGVTLEEVGSILNLTRERIRQMETRALVHLKDRVDPLDLVG